MTILLTLLRGNVICFLAGLTYNHTSVMFINIPSISKLQWHPFTVTSNSNLEPNNLSVKLLLKVKELGARSSISFFQLLPQCKHNGNLDSIQNNFLKHKYVRIHKGLREINITQHRENDSKLIEYHKFRMEQ